MEQTLNADVTVDNVTQTENKVAGLASLNQSETTKESTQVSKVVDNTPMAKFNDLLDESGKFTDRWTEKLPDGFKEHSKTLSKFSDPVALMTSYVSLEKAYSQKSSSSVKLPGDDASEADWSKYRDAIGAPKDAKDYGISKPQDIPDEQWNSALADKVTTVALKYGIPAKAMHELVDTYNGSMKDLISTSQDAVVKQADTTVTTLTNEWGVESKNNWQKANRAATALGLPLDDNSILRPDIVRALVRIDDLISEDKGLVKGGDARETYQEQIDKLKSSDAYQGKKGHKVQMETQARIMDLMKAMQS